MSKKEDEAFDKWLGELKAQSPDMAAHLDALATSDAGRELFRGKAVRESDYYRRLNELNSEREKIAAEKSQFETLVAEQTKWFQGAKPEYERALARAKEYDQLQKVLAEKEAKLKELGVQTNNSTPPLPSHREEDDITARQLQDLQNRVQQMDQAFPHVLAQFLEVQSRAIKEGYDVDPNQILQQVYSQKVDPRTAFEQITREERQKRAEADLEKRLSQAREEGKREALSKLQGPERIPLSAPSIVETLRSKEGTAGITNSRERVDAAIADFLELQSQS